MQLLIQFILISTKIIPFLFILFLKCKGLRNSHNYLFIAEFIKRKIEGEENKDMKLEILIAFGARSKVYTL